MDIYAVRRILRKDNHDIIIVYTGATHTLNIMNIFEKLKYKKLYEKGKHESISPPFTYE